MDKTNNYRESKFDKNKNKNLRWFKYGAYLKSYAIIRWQK
jgi:hypothetical protein